MRKTQFIFLLHFEECLFFEDRQKERGWGKKRWIYLLRLSKTEKEMERITIYSFYKQGLFVCLVGFLTTSSTNRLYRGRAPRQERLTILRAATHETELGDHDFCLSRSHYTDTDPTCRERAATAGIEPRTSSPGVARSTAELPRPPNTRLRKKQKLLQSKEVYEDVFKSKID